jgi:hypothetical protein
MGRNGHARALAHCHGFLAVATDGQLGEIETPLFPPDWREPDYLIVRTTQEHNHRLRRPVIPTGLVEEVDEERKVLHLRGTVRQLAHMPESVPLTRSRGGR